MINLHPLFLFTVFVAHLLPHTITNSSLLATIAALRLRVDVSSRTRNFPSRASPVDYDLRRIRNSQAATHNPLDTHYLCAPQPAPAIHASQSLPSASAIPVPPHTHFQTHESSNMIFNSPMRTMGTKILFFSLLCGPTSAARVRAALSRTSHGISMSAPANPTSGVLSTPRIAKLAGFTAASAAALSAGGAPRGVVLAALAGSVACTTPGLVDGHLAVSYGYGAAMLWHAACIGKLLAFPMTIPAFGGRLLAALLGGEAAAPLLLAYLAYGLKVLVLQAARDLEHVYI